MGRVLAEMNPIKADVIIPMPDTARAMAQGYGEATGIPIVNAIAKNPYVGRSFLLRGDDRATVLADKHRVIPDEVQGLRVIVAEDSVVKGNTLLSVGRALRAAGAKEIHVISAATRFERACFMGLDTGDPNELIAGKMTDAEMCEYLGIDSITFNTPEGMERAVAMAAESTDNVRWRTGSLCVSCATGEYPFKLADESKRDGPVTIGMPSFAA